MSTEECQHDEVVRKHDAQIKAHQKAFNDIVRTKDQQADIINDCKSRIGNIEVALENTIDSTNKLIDFIKELVVSHNELAKQVEQLSK
jgi:hypothetical protein